MDAPPVALVSLLTTDRRLIYRPVQHLTSCQSGVWSGAGNSQIVSATATAWRFPSTTAWCPAGKKVVGGGATCSTPGGSIWLVHSLPIGDNGWSGTCDTTQKQNASIVVYATCL